MKSALDGAALGKFSRGDLGESRGSPGHDPLRIRDRHAGARGLTMVILAIDDEPFVAEMIQEILEQEGHACLTASSVDEAEWILRSVGIDLMLLDVGMPGRQPLSWLEDLALAEPERARRTVMITGYRLDEVELMRIQACGAGLLNKPFRIDDLLEAIRLHDPGPLGASRETPHSPREENDLSAPD